MNVEFHILYYQPSRHICSQIAIIYTFVAAKMLLHRWKQMIRTRQLFPQLLSQSD